MLRLREQAFRRCKLAGSRDSSAARVDTGSASLLLFDRVPQVPMMWARCATVLTRAA